MFIFYDIINVTNNKLIFVTTFSSLELAQKYLYFEQQEYSKHVYLYEKYIIDYVDKIELPLNLNLEQWENFIKDFPLKSCTCPSNFKNNLKKYLLKNKTFSKIDFVPPKYKYEKLMILERPNSMN